jgi:hypothetical protein
MECFNFWVVKTWKHSIECHHFKYTSMQLFKIDVDDVNIITTMHAKFFFF